MNFQRLLVDARGASAIEFGITAPLFVMLVVGTIEGGLLLWTQLGLQQGVEMGARCASVNTVLCNSTSAVQNYAAQKTFGINPPASVFTMTTRSCGIQVSASYTFPYLSNYFGGPTLSAQACFPH